MIMSPNIKSENDYYKIFKTVKIAFTKLNSNIQNTKGRPRKYSDEQIVACILYCVKNSIFSLRELEYRIKQDYMFRSIIQLDQVPDYSTFSLRTKILEQHIYYGIYAMFVELINPETRLCAIDGTALRSLKYDSEAKSGKGTRLGYYKGYKLHCVATITDIIIPLVFDLTTANVYDNQVSDLLYEVKIYDSFLIFADAAYDSAEWFEIVSNLEFNLLTDVNMRKARSIE
ncbi:transposase [uncultured Clostridium sp.]|uniref:transposase n=1 Tax=uncultured Clostridium sp. TaxID=59620 RepID=UPI0028EDF912|nr:transposase [uncultured Clostridium sp.]